MDDITNKVLALNIKDDEDLYLKKIIKIQSIWRGYFYRRNHLPNSILYIRHILHHKKIEIASDNEDGRINSCMDEEKCILLLQNELHNRIVKPQKRWWYDFKIYDFLYGWLPVNIKTTTMKTADNVGNLTLCVYALTDYQIDLERNYMNGEMSVQLISMFQNKQFNKKLKRDYYFLVINKKDPEDIIVNSYKGLVSIKSNLHNLPFQVVWKENRYFHYNRNERVAGMLLHTLQKPEPSWEEKFMASIRSIGEDTFT
jgi:hypothetical protein